MARIPQTLRDMFGKHRLDRATLGPISANATPMLRRYMPQFARIRPICWRSRLNSDHIGPTSGFGRFRPTLVRCRPTLDRIQPCCSMPSEFGPNLACLWQPLGEFKRARRSQTRKLSSTNNAKTCPDASDASAVCSFFQVRTESGPTSATCDQCFACSPPKLARKRAKLAPLRPTLSRSWPSSTSRRSEYTRFRTKSASCGPMSVKIGQPGAAERQSSWNA